MVAATRKPVAAKKRKVSDSPVQQPELCKKKSPLFNQPQNFYAPPSISSMSKDELTTWRKEQRRKRNRESAAASRNKTRVRIDELEGEVDKWRSLYHDMEVKMRCMERHIQFLTKMAQPPVGAMPPPPPTAQLAPPAMVVSHPNSPPRSPRPHGAGLPLVPHTVTSLAPPPPAYLSHANPANPFPSLLSEAKVFTPVEEQVAADATFAVVSIQEPKEHLNSISRQAVKNTGAPFGSKDSNVKQPAQQQLPALPTCESSVEVKMEDGVVGGVKTSSGSADEVPGKVAVPPNQVISQTTSPILDTSEIDVSPINVDVSTLESSSPECSDDDVDLLDLLVDTLDGEFDPDLMI